MKHVIFIAPPMAGKGTFSAFLETKFGYTHISTGDLIREEAKKNPQFEEDLKQGKLTDDSTILDLVTKKLKEYPENTMFIFDGVPRTLHQAEVLDIMIRGLKIKEYVVVNIDVSKNTLEERLLGRRICPNCQKTYNINTEGFKPHVDNTCDDCGATLISRSDDSLESYQVRYQNYIQSTLPLIAFYRQKGCLKIISNEGVDQTKALEELVGVIK